MALSAGLAAEQTVRVQFNDAGWTTRISQELDHVRSTDMAVVCPGYRYLPVQVSLHPKSGGERRRLAEEGVTTIAVSDLERSGQTAPEKVCRDCPRQLCAARLAAIALD